MEKALIFKHNLPYDVNVHPVAEDTITLVPRFENDKVRDLYIDYHLQGHTDSYLGLGQWKRDLEKMPARSLVYKNAKEITFNIDIVNYNEDVLNRNFAVTKTESGNYKFWWIKQIERIGQLKATLYKITLTLDYWWTYGIDNLFDNDKQVMIKRAHVRNYEYREYPLGSKNYYYQELKDIWSNPFINAGEEFTPNESNYIIEDYEYLTTPLVYTKSGREILKEEFWTTLSKRINVRFPNLTYSMSPHWAEIGISCVVADIFFYWQNSIDAAIAKDSLYLNDFKSIKNTSNIITVGMNYSFNYNDFAGFYGFWPNIQAFYDYTLDNDNGNCINPFLLISDPQKVPLTSFRTAYNFVLDNLFLDSYYFDSITDYDKFINDNFSTRVNDVNETKLIINNLDSFYHKTTFGLNEDPVWLINYRLTHYDAYDGADQGWSASNRLRFDKFFRSIYYSPITALQFNINQPRTLDEVKLHNDPYTKYRIIMPSKNQMDIMNQYVSNLTFMYFDHTYIFDPGQTQELILPYSWIDAPNAIYGINNNYNLTLIDNTNYTWVEESNAYDNYMLQNKSRLHQNQVDKYVHAGFKTAEDAAGAVGSFLSGHWGAGASGAIKVAEDAYSIYQVHADYAAKMQDLKRTPGKWESKSNNLMSLNAYKQIIPCMFKLKLSEPLYSITKNLFIAHGYNIGGYHKIYQFINGNHQRYFFNYLQAMNCLNIISKELSLAIKMAIQADLAQGIQIRHLRAKMFNPNGSWKYKNKFNDYDVNNVEYDLAIVPENENN